MNLVSFGLQQNYTFFFFYAKRLHWLQTFPSELHSFPTTSHWKLKSASAGKKILENFKTCCAKTNRFMDTLLWSGMVIQKRSLRACHPWQCPTTARTPVGLHTKRNLKGEDRWLWLTIYCTTYLPAGDVGGILHKNRSCRGKNKFLFVTCLTISSWQIFSKPFSPCLRRNVT